MTRRIGPHPSEVEDVKAKPTFNPSGKALRGFAAMPLEKRREIAKKGGAATASENRSFSKDRELAAKAGAKGGSAPRNALARKPFRWPKGLK